MTTKEDNPLIISVAQAAVLLGISTRSAYTLCRRKDFPSVRLTPNRIGVSRIGLADWIAAQVEKGIGDDNDG